MLDNLLRNNKTVIYTFCDFETFNLCLNWRHNRVWQAGLLKVQGEKIIESKDLLINWSGLTHLKIGEEAARITRYDQDKVNRLGIKPEKAWPILEKMLNECDYIIGHNFLGFDIYLLKGFAESQGADWKHLTKKVIDTKALAQGIKLESPYKKPTNLFEYQYQMNATVVKGVKTRLELLGKEYGIEHDYEHLHDAITDLELNLKVWNKIKYQVEI